jgi:NADH-quinone oxidoreductase subunit J
MIPIFYISAALAIVATLMMLTRLHIVHALLYLIVSLLAVSVVFYTLGAPFIAALEVIIYAGAIMVLFVFVVMMLNLGEQAAATEAAWLSPGIWIGPSILAAILIGEVAYIATRLSPASQQTVVTPKQLGITLFGPYLIGVELASILLLAGLVGAYHLGRQNPEPKEKRNDTDSARSAVSGDLVRAGADRTAGTT